MGGIITRIENLAILPNLVEVHHVYSMRMR
jgi:hypothetical protein